MTEHNLAQLLKRPHYALLGLLACLFGTYLTLLWQIGDIAHFGMSVLFLLAALTLIWENHTHFNYRYEWLASLTGMGFIGWVLWQSASIVSEQQFQLRLFPFLSGLGIALLASSFQGLLQYRRELALMFFLGVPSTILNLIDISPLTAAMASNLLVYGGLNAMQQGRSITLPAGTLEVDSSCSGIESITYLLGIAVFCLTLYPVCRPKQVMALLAACTIGFVANSIRVAIMTTLVSPENQPTFLYWQEGEGSLIFGIGALACFASFYWSLHQLELWQRRTGRIRP